MRISRVLLALAILAMLVQMVWAVASVELEFEEDDETEMEGSASSAAGNRRETIGNSGYTRGTVLLPIVEPFTRMNEFVSCKSFEK